MNVANATVPRLDDRPFAVRSGQHGQHPSVVVSNRSHELRLLAAHDVGHAGGVDAARTGDDRELAAGCRRERAPEPREVRRAFDVRRLDPTLAAADHPARDPRGAVVPPVVKERVESRRRTVRRAATRCRARAARIATTPPVASRRYARADVVPQSIAIKAVLRESVTARDGSRRSSPGQEKPAFNVRNRERV